MNKDFQFWTFPENVVGKCKNFSTVSNRSNQIFLR